MKSEFERALYLLETIGECHMGDLSEREAARYHNIVDQYRTWVFDNKPSKPKRKYIGEVPPEDLRRFK